MSVNPLQNSPLSTLPVYSASTVSAFGSLILNNYVDSSNPYQPGTASDNLTNNSTFDLSVANINPSSKVQYQLLTNGVWQNTNAAQNLKDDGKYEFRALITDTAGHTQPTNTVAVTIDTVAPSNPMEAQFSHDRRVLTGKAEAGSTVILKDADGKVLGTSIVAEDGNFKITLASGLASTQQYQVSAMDAAGNESGNVHTGIRYNVFSVLSGWDRQTGPKTYENLKLTHGDDWIQIGNGPSNGICSWDKGNIGNICYRGPVFTIDTGLGNDRIETGVTGGCGDIWGRVVIDMGADNDSLMVKGNIHQDAVIKMGTGNDLLVVGEDIDDNAVVYMGNNTSGIEGGNDTVIVKEDIENNAKVYFGGGDDLLKVDRFITNNAYVNMGATGNDKVFAYALHCKTQLVFGSGNNLLDVTEDVDDHVKVTIGDGNNFIRVGEDIENWANITLGNGNNSLSVNRYIEDCSVINMGNGNNSLSARSIVNDAKVTLGNGHNDINLSNDLTWKASITTGNGDNSISLGGDIECWARLTTGSGDDSLTARFIENQSRVDLGDGNNTMTVAGINNWAVVDFGAGNDKLTITKEFGASLGNATANMGAGNDTVIYQGKTLCGVINGGDGNDTLVLDYQKDDSMVNKWAWCNITNLSSKNFTGFETIQMQGKNVVDISYRDLLNDNTRSGPLLIKGGGDSKVDIGSTNWSSDSSSKASMRDSDGGNWSKVGTNTVDNITYDVYHHSAAGNNPANDVYVQQGVMVI